MVERDKNNPAVFMWSIGNEIGEANGDPHSLATVKRLVKVIKDVDKTVMLPWEQISSVSVMVAVVMKNC